MKMGIIAIGLSSEGVPACCERASGKVKTMPIAKSTLGRARKTCRFMASTRSRLTTQAQRPGARDAMIANHDAMPGSLQRMVSLQFIVNQHESSQ